jgi:DNA-binding CsgD family transcriptional regulator
MKISELAFNLFPIKRPKVQNKRYESIDQIINMLDKISSSLNLSMYLVDYKLLTFQYVSNHPLFLCGYNKNTVKELGYNYYKYIIDKKELDFLEKVNKAGFNFFYEQPRYLRDQLIIEYNFDIKHINGIKNRINHLLIPFVITDEGDIWLSLCIVSLSVYKSFNYAFIKNVNTNEYYLYNDINSQWKLQEMTTLTNQEQLILQLSAQGNTNKQLADMLRVNINTIKFHKKNIFNKLETNNITESVSKSLFFGII